MDHVRVLRQISVVAALFYLDNSRKIHLRGVRACQLKDAKRRVPQRQGERERESAHARGREGVHACGGVGKRERESTHAHVGERARMHAWERESVCTWGREREKALWLLLLYVFSSPWTCPMQIGLSQECCLSDLRSSLWSSDLLLTFLCSIFTGFSLPCLLATATLNSFSLF